MISDQDLFDELKYDITIKNGNKLYRNHNGEIHRDDGPAVIYSDGMKMWYRNDELHREDGPAIICYNGRKLWYLDGEEYTKEEWEHDLRSRHL
jgi:hypothetical protein